MREHAAAMCGRVYIKSSLEQLMASFSRAQRGEIVPALGNSFPRWNGAPRQDYPLIVAEHGDDEAALFVRANWGFVPRWMKDPRGGVRPINVKSESVATTALFREAYRRRRALMPIDGFFEWKDVLGTGRDKQPYAIAMADGSPFALAAIWETWRHPDTREQETTFAVLTCAPNAMVAEIHDRMPVILHPADYRRWLSEEADPRDLLVPFPTELMAMWPIDRKVGKVSNNTPDIIDRVDDLPSTLL